MPKKPNKEHLDFDSADQERFDEMLRAMLNTPPVPDPRRKYKEQQTTHKTDTNKKPGSK